MQFTKEELRNLSLLIQKAPITGVESLPVALLLNKIGDMIVNYEKEAKPEQQSPEIRNREEKGKN